MAISRRTVCWSKTTHTFFSVKVPVMQQVRLLDTNLNRTWNELWVSYPKKFLIHFTEKCVINIAEHLHLQSSKCMVTKYVSETHVQFPYQLSVKCHHIQIQIIIKKFRSTRPFIRPMIAMVIPRFRWQMPAGETIGTWWLRIVGMLFGKPEVWCTSSGYGWNRRGSRRISQYSPKSKWHRDSHTKDCYWVSQNFEKGVTHFCTLHLDRWFLWWEF